MASKPTDAVEREREFPDYGKNVAPPRVLVVDDEWLVRWSIAETLTVRGYTVIEAADAQSALRFFAEGVDLVLLDLHLPDADDLSVLARMRSLAPDTPVIVMTAFATPATVDAAAAYGAPVMGKPFDLTDVTARVQQALDGSVY